MSSTGSAAVEAKDCGVALHGAAVVKLVAPATRRTVDDALLDDIFLQTLNKLHQLALLGLGHIKFGQGRSGMT